MSVLSRKVLGFKLHSDLFVSGTNIGSTVPSSSKSFTWAAESFPEGILFTIKDKDSVVIPWANVQYASLGANLKLDQK